MFKTLSSTGNNKRSFDPSSERPYIFSQKITVRNYALAEGSDPRVECETRAAGVAIGKFVR
jgi:hypothetical protein